MIRKMFPLTIHSKQNIAESLERRKEKIQFLPTNDDDKHFKRSIKKIAKTPREEIQIKEAITKNDFLNDMIKGQRMDQIIQVIYSQDVTAGEVIIKEGEIGSQMFISGEGTYDIILRDDVVNRFDDVRVFGELAILYNVARRATIRAFTNGKIWVLDSCAYKEKMIRTQKEEHIENLHFLKDVSVLNTVDEAVLDMVADILEPIFFDAGTDIVKEGEKGDKFYIVKAGIVQVKRKDEGNIGTLSKSQYFGERALINDDVRQATITVEPPGTECLVLSRHDFIKHFGTIEEFVNIQIKPALKDSNGEAQDYVDLNLQDFKILRTLGIGGFGRVELIQHKTNKDQIFALKYLAKDRIVLENQRNNIFREKGVHSHCKTPFIITMYKTFRDNKYIYFMLEAQLGGDLWRLLYRQRGKPFNEIEAKFYTACVIEAFQYLHSRGIIYRDLKPENLLVAANGYLKLTDFGFSKKLGDDKSYSFVGTPEYISPEMVMNRSHNKGVDYWALGIFIYELLSCKTPFKTDDPSFMKTYKLIINGIDKVRFPSWLSSKAKSIVKKFCKNNPTQRLGYSRTGFDDIKTHSWFSGFNWKSLENLSMEAPFKPELTSNVDTKYFDVFKRNMDVVSDDTSGWDIDF